MGIKIKSQKGFTIVELMIATAVFGAIMLMAVAVVIQVGRMYNKGVISSRTQEVARGIMDEFTQQIQLSASGITPANSDTNPFGSFCIGNTRYIYETLQHVTEDSPDPARLQQSHALWAYTVPSCATAAGLPIVDANTLSAPPNPLSDGRELLSENMRINRIVLEPLDSPTNSVWRVRVAVSYGDFDLLTVDGSGNYTCTGQLVSSQFCATSDLTTIVTRRVL